MLSIINRTVLMDKNGTLTLEGLPFADGESLEVKIAPSVSEVINKGDELRGTVLQYDDPYSPVEL